MGDQCKNIFFETFTQKWSLGPKGVKCYQTNMAAHDVTCKTSKLVFANFPYYYSGLCTLVHVLDLVTR